MPRTKSGTTTHQRHKKVLKAASGGRGTRHKLYKTARDAVRKSLAFGYMGRKLKKRNYRALWIARINAAARDNDLSYSRLISGLKKAGVTMDRRVLANIALSDPKGFAEIATVAKGKLD